MFFSVHLLHRNDYTPWAFYELGITLGTSYMLIPAVAVEHSRAWHHHGSHMAMALVRMVTHPIINWAYDCLTSVINDEMLPPSYRGFHMRIWAMWQTFFKGACANNVKGMYTSASGHVVGCLKFIRGIYTKMLTHICTWTNLHMLHFRGIFVGGTYKASAW